MKHLYDTHFHLDLQSDKVGAIREIEEHQIYTIAVTNLPDLYRRGLEQFASKYVRLALGFHPELIQQFTNQIPIMWDYLPASRYIGEVGLDFCNPQSKREQILFFSELIDRCRYDSKKIISIHSRRAVKDVLEIIGTTYRFKPILHWFSGSKADLIRAIDNGFYFSINPAMMISRNFRSLLPIIPKEKLLLETDSPFVDISTTHSDCLNSLECLLLTEKYGCDLWGNFLRIIE